MKAELILALMLHLGPTPGKSIYSVVEVPEGSPPACDDEYSLLCREPRWDPDREAWVRPETFEEGLQRYWTIARAISEVGKGNEAGTRYLIAVTRHESGWRRDVHEGVGKWSRGDQGRSWCLGQLMVGRSPNSKALAGYRAKDLVGTSYEATKRCLTAVRAGLSRAMRACGANNDVCVFSTYGGTTLGMKHKGIRDRVGSFRNLLGLRVDLDEQLKDVLGLDA